MFFKQYFCERKVTHVIPGNLENAEREPCYTYNLNILVVCDHPERKNGREFMLLLYHALPIN